MANFIQPDKSKVLIIDISKWQDDPNTAKIVDFESFRANGVSGVIVKCGEANSIDRAFLAYIRAMEEVNMPYGVYWYYNNKYSPKNQANLFVKTLKDNRVSPKLGLWLDLEDRNVGNYEGWKNWYDFLSIIQSNFAGYRIGIYTGHYYFTEKLSSAPKSSLNWFAQFPLWLAWYGENYKIPKPWTSWTLWQFTDFLDGESFGAESKELDGNYFYGSLSEFNDFFGIDEKPKERTLVKIIYIYSDGSQEERYVSNGHS